MRSGWGHMALKSLAEIDFAQLIQRKFTPSPDCWADQIPYFLMLDRFSDGNEQDGHRDAQDRPVNNRNDPRCDRRRYRVRTVGDELRLLLSYTPESGLEPLE